MRCEMSHRTTVKRYMLYNSHAATDAGEFVRHVVNAGPGGDVGHNLYLADLLQDNDEPSADVVRRVGEGQGVEVTPANRYTVPNQFDSAGTHKYDTSTIASAPGYIPVLPTVPDSAGTGNLPSDAVLHLSYFNHPTGHFWRLFYRAGGKMREFLVPTNPEEVRELAARLRGGSSGTDRESGEQIDRVSRFPPGHRENAYVPPTPDRAPNQPQQMQEGPREISENTNTQLSRRVAVKRYAFTGYQTPIKGVTSSALLPVLSGSRLAVVLKEIGSKYGSDAHMKRLVGDAMKGVFARGGNDTFTQIRDRLLQHAARGGDSGERAQQLAENYNWHRVGKKLNLDGAVAEFVNKTANERLKGQGIQFRAAHNVFGHGREGYVKPASDEARHQFLTALMSHVRATRGAYGHTDINERDLLDSLNRLAANEGGSERLKKMAPSGKIGALNPANPAWNPDPNAEAGVRVRPTKTPTRAWGIEPGQYHRRIEVRRYMAAPIRAVNTGETSHQALTRFLGNRNVRAHGRTARVERLDGGDIGVFLHGHQIVTAHPNGQVTLNHSGYMTPTTRRFMSGYSGLGVSFAGGRFMIGHNGNWEEYENGTRYPPQSPDEEQSFEQAVRANPEDATGHGAYADWLDEHGRHEEAAHHRAESQRLLGGQHHMTRRVRPRRYGMVPPEVMGYEEYNPFRGILYSSHPKGQRGGYSENDHMAAMAEHTGVLNAMRSLGLLKERQPNETIGQADKRIRNRVRDVTDLIRRYTWKFPDDKLTKNYLQIAHRLKVPGSEGQTPEGRLSLAPLPVGPMDLMTPLVPLIKHLNTVTEMEPSDKPIDHPFTEVHEPGEIDLAEPHFHDKPFGYGATIPHEGEQAGPEAFVPDVSLPEVGGTSPVIGQVERGANKQIYQTIADHDEMGFDAQKPLLDTLVEKHSLSPEEARKHIGNYRRLKGKPAPSPELAPKPTKRVWPPTPRQDRLSRLVARKYAAYRAPAGGMVVRGTHYTGGEMVPDMKGAFANPPQTVKPPIPKKPLPRKKFKPKAPVKMEEGDTPPAGIGATGPEVVSTPTVEYGQRVKARKMTRSRRLG